MPSESSKAKHFFFISSLLIVSVLLLLPGGLLGLQTGMQNHAVANAASNPPTAIQIDGSDFNSVTNQSIVKTPITTAQSPDVIIAFVALRANTTVSTTIKDTFTLTWYLRENSTFAPYHAEIFEYYAIATFPLSADQITVTANASANIDVKVFGVAGANTTTTTSAFDTGLPTPANKGGTTSPFVSVTTTHADDMILAMAYINGGPNITPGSGFSCVGKSNSCSSFASNPVAYAQYMVVSTPQTALHVSASLSIPQSWVIIGDALVQLLPSSSTAVSCTPGPVTIGSSTTCTATVTGSSPTGSVSWSTSGAGTFSANSCALSSGACQITFTSSISGSSSVIASYSGDAANAPSFGTYSLSVTPATTTTSVSCAPSTLSLGSSTACSAKVTGFSPTGNVTFTSSDSAATFTPVSCALSSGTCQVTFQPSGTGAPTVNASYAGDVNNSPSSGSTSVTVSPTASSTTTTTTSASTTTTTSTTTSTTTTSKPAPILSSDTIIAIVVAIVVIVGAIVASLFIRKRSRRY